MVKFDKFSKNGTNKYIFYLADNSIIEMASFIHKSQKHFCVSTQVGCPIGCKHCATTYSKVQFRRSITSEELISCIDYMLSQENDDMEKVLSFSGHGEPLLNLAVVKKVRENFIHDFKSFYLTTIGIREKLSEIKSSEDNKFTFYISMHGSSDLTRSMLIRNSEKYSTIAELFDFIRSYSTRGGKIVINYMLHKNNSSPSDISLLLKHLEGLNKNVRLRITDYNRINHDTDIVPLNEEERNKVLSYFDESNIGKQEWLYNYSKLEGAENEIACGQLRSSILHMS
ncbi:radical SAM protein [Anaerocolumna jejuensis]|uniref:radical SAM protein n=1 Tax=Anaerocolumna jejuensis TaxID=259063 RepID=UPI003F7C8098